MPAISASQAPPPLVKTALGFAGETGDDPRHVMQGELAILRAREYAAPGVEQHHGLGAGGDLRIQIQDRGLREQPEQPMEVRRGFVHHALDDREALAAAALHHVRTDRPGTAGEADERNAAGQLAPDQRNRVDHVAELARGIGDAELVDIRGGPDGPGKFRTLSGLEVQTEIHRMGDGQNIREQNGGIERIPIDRLQRHFAGEIGIGAQREEISGPRTRRAVLGQISSRLAHEPDRPARCRLPEQGPKQQIVLERSGHVRSAGSNRRRCSRIA
jgi:hypothetical protein